MTVPEPARPPTVIEEAALEAMYLASCHESRAEMFRQQITALTAKLREAETDRNDQLELVRTLRYGGDWFMPGAFLDLEKKALIWTDGIDSMRTEFGAAAERTVKLLNSRQRDPDGSLRDFVRFHPTPVHTNNPDLESESPTDES